VYDVLIVTVHSFDLTYTNQTVIYTIYKWTNCYVIYAIPWLWKEMGSLVSVVARLWSGSQRNCC